MRKIYVVLENYVVLTLNLTLYHGRTERVAHLKRLCHGCWLVSILLAIVLDHLMQRGSAVKYIKHLLDLPLATVLTCRYRMSNGIISAFGLLSSTLGVYLHWKTIRPRW